jgi:hypothetical protein
MKYTYNVELKSDNETIVVVEKALSLWHWTTRKRHRTPTKGRIPTGIINVSMQRDKNNYIDK